MFVRRMVCVHDKNKKVNLLIKEKWQKTCFWFVFVKRYAVRKAKIRQYESSK